MALTADDWPITAALLQSPGIRRDGSSVQDAPAETWREKFEEVADAGFDAVDLTDSWVRPGDLAPERLDEFAGAVRAAGIAAPVISLVRKSVLDAQHGDANLAYSHRSIEAAAAIGARVVCVGLHQALTPAQQQALWFWTVPGHVDPDDPAERARAVRRFQELGRHAAEVGVLLSLELYEDTYLGTAESAVRLVEEVGMPEVGLNPDVGNLVRLHRPIESWRELYAATLPYANYWQAKNYARDEDPIRGWYTAVPAPLETGMINYREVFQEALAAGFQGIVCTEHYGGDGLSVSASNRDYLRRYAMPKRDGYRLGTSRVTQPGLALPRTDSKNEGLRPQREERS
ncbi:sugar phosphate isomerase/epimerase family protein [Naasia aerilata]|uniref:Xylose isomerase n=1 Tax=Naasia aerilata TaxID=1162966 RepID=A0ABM8G8Q7_9MICO|nr:sugar phosphate isomerase/epimerase family protein [Naasia aerilata]BDZ44547.1 xylose isomerase [Naasia aerilata]